MNTNTIRAIHSITATAGASLLLALLPVPATASQDRGEAVTNRVSVRSEACPLERVGTQYVRCDNLTGAGVPAPSWVSQQPSATTDATDAGGAGSAKPGTPHAPWDFAP
jgi:hypothetical protein